MSQVEESLRRNSLAATVSKESRQPGELGGFGLRPVQWTIRSPRMEIAFKEIEKEFNETFGYVRQDIAKILEKNLGLNLRYWSVALVRC
jgi:hypothetical protein